MLEETKKKVNLPIKGQELERQKEYSYPHSQLWHTGDNHNQSEITITETEK